MKRLTFVFIAVLTALILTGCPGVGPETEPDPTTYTVIYNGNESTGGTVPTDSNVYEEGATVTVLDNTGSLVKQDYVFSSWNTKSDGTGVDRAADSTFSIGSTNVILYAKWIDYNLGDTGPAGGLIFYIDEANAFSWDYLEAALVSTEWTSTQWSSSGTLIGGTGTAIGDGITNTTTVAAWLDGDGQTDRAAQLCCDLTEGGYSDWFLPSKNELDLMYTNLYQQGVGDFTVDFYWSSSEFSDIAACRQYFDNFGNQTNTFKFGEFRVRAVRAF
jgi:uncharacterized membrane protein